MNRQVYEEASAWIVKHRGEGLDAHDKQCFDAWLRESPQHMRAYLEMSSVWEEMSLLDSSWNPGADELIARARADSNVASLFSSPSVVPETAQSDECSDVTSEAGERTEDRVVDSETAQVLTLRADDDKDSPTSWKVRLLFALAASILLAVTGSWFLTQRGLYTTDTGERRSLTLADGSTVELNSRSRMRVRYTEHERLIDLLEGQAMFHVVKSPSRPFIVQADNTRVRAVGTSFDVYKAGARTVVTVVEGRVAVRAEQRSSVTQRMRPEADGAGSASSADVSGMQRESEEILVAAGEQVVVTPTTVTARKQAPDGSTTAWTQRSLVFDSSPLTDVAQEFNRYNTRRLVIEDPELADFRVSGVFSSGDSTLFLRFLRAQPELVIEETETEIRIKRK